MFLQRVSIQLWLAMQIAVLRQGRKICNVQPISRRISETVQDRTIVTMTDQ